MICVCGVEGPRKTCHVAAFRWLNLDNVSAVVGQDLRTEGTGKRLRQIKDAQTSQGTEWEGFGHLSPQWLRRLRSTRRSPWKICWSRWFTP